MEFSPFHWLVVLLIIGFLLVPIARIIRRTGNSPWWCLLFFVPLGNLIGLWLLAFLPWPATDGAARSSPTGS
jgi:hypothetical protein